MGFNPANLPPHVLKLIDAKERKRLGKAGQTPAETMAKADAKNEKALQQQCINLLRLRGVEPIVNRMDKKTSNNLGVADLLFSITGFDGYQHRVYACAIECKMPGKYLRAEQILMRKKMTAPPNAWTHRTIRSVDELRTFLEGIGL